MQYGGHTSGASGVMVTRKRYMETAMPAIMAKRSACRGLPCVPSPCCLNHMKRFHKFMLLSLYRFVSSTMEMYTHTHPGNGSVRDEACCDAPSKTSNLQGTHVRTACGKEASA